MASDNETTSPAKAIVDPSSHNGETTHSTKPEPAVEEEEGHIPANEASPSAQNEPQSAPSPADSRSEEGEASSNDSKEEGAQRARDGDDSTSNGAPPLPNEPTPDSGDAPPPLPAEAPPGQAAAAATESDDGWTAQWDATNQTWYFYNHFTGISQWDNPRLAAPSAPSTSAAAAAATATATATPQISQPTSIAGGYNPAIHGSWDPNAAYAQAYKEPDTAAAADEAEYQADLAAYHAEMDGSDPTSAAEGFEYAGTVAGFNRRTGKAQAGDQNPERHSDASKSYRQMNAYFNVDQAANSYDGRSLKAERRGKQPTRKELSMWKEKRKARKEEKRRAWLRD